MLPWRSITPGLALLVVVALTRTAHADLVAEPAAMPPVAATAAPEVATPGIVAPPAKSGCAFEGYGPDVCKDLPLAAGVCISVGATAGKAVTDALTKEGFRQRCTGEFFNAYGPPGHQACEQQTLAEWCLDVRPEGFAGGRAELCDLEAYAGCQVAQRINSLNARVVEKVCLERSEMLHGMQYRDSWERCRATWEANGVALPVETAPGAATTANPVVKPGCGVCTVGDGEGAAAGLLWVVCLGIGASGRRRAAA